jgi:hypothetical protein
VVGKVGTLLAEAGINIADIHLARTERTDHAGGEREAMAVLRLDQEPSDDLLARLAALNVVRQARRVNLGRR